MHTTDHLEIKDHIPAADAHPHTDRLKIRGDALVARVKELLHEGNVKRITVKNPEGNAVIEIPVTAGVVAAIVAPVLTAVAALGALASDWQIDVHPDNHPGD